MDNRNKKILFNTGVVYARLIITTIIGLLSSRYVLQALGASDYGLYAVVGGIITMLNILSIAMYTTTQRFVNVEMGRPDGNLNRIFNISLLLHMGFALFLFIIAETIGLFYIYNFLNVASEKLDDALFVFQVSTIAAAISIVNIPYQALMQSFERFAQMAVFDICVCVIKLAFVVLLLTFENNILRIYALGMSVITVLSLIFYVTACKVQWKDVIKIKLYKEKATYKEILYFNNFVALGATSYMSRTQAANMLVNYFFGTLVNAAFAIGYTIENYCMMFVSCVGSAAEPQITQNYSNNNSRSLFLTEVLNKLSIYLTLLIVVPFYAEMEFILELWLKDVPEGAVLVCHLTLLSALTRVVFGGMDKLVQASGKNKWFQISGSVFQLSVIPISFLLFKIGYPAYSIIVLFIIVTVASSLFGFFLMNRILNFDVKSYALHVYVPSFRVIFILLLLIIIYYEISIDSFGAHLLGLAVCLFLTALTVFYAGLNCSEKGIIRNFLICKLFNRNSR